MRRTLPFNGVDLEDRTWTVSSTRVGTGFHVRPVRGLMSCGNWALFRDPSWPWWLRGLNYCWRVITDTYGRRERPRTERGLRKAIAECERWCEIENRREATAEVVLNRAQS